jgi:hypothetical protein
MARKPNDIKTVPISLSTTPQVEGYLKQLLKTGLYGKNAADAAERLLTRTLEEMLRAGRIKPPRSR